MAVRDKNLVAWQAYVITMAFISVGLMLGMFFLYRTYADTAKRTAEMSTQLAEAGTKYQKSESRVRRLKSMLGYGEHTKEELDAMAAEMAADPDLGVVEKDFAENKNETAPREGIGCWHPVFPARSDDVWLLAATGFKIMTRTLNDTHSQSFKVFEQNTDFDGGITRILREEGIDPIELSMIISGKSAMKPSFEESKFS